MHILNEIEIRILGALIEKQYTTPEYYPLTLNSTTLACNQKSNRDPVMELEETTVLRALDELREKKLVYKVEGAGYRVPKYEQSITDILKLDLKETAILSVLMLRGEQTLGELRTRSARIYDFADLSEVDNILDNLAKREEPLISKLPRQTGLKESRYIHLLSGKPLIVPIETEGLDNKVRIKVVAENERIAILEEEVDSLKNRINNIEEQLATFIKEFQ